MSETGNLSAAALTRELAIINQRGLHARASAKFVKCAETFQAEIEVSRDGQTVPGTSITVRAEGPDAEAALDALAELVGAKFGEDD